MKIHGDFVCGRQVYAAAAFAARKAGHGSVYVDRCETHGSRKRARALDVKLEGDGSHSRRRVNLGTARNVDRFNAPFAATWESWGWFLGYLFTVDPTLTTPYDVDAAAFHERTAGAFRVDERELADWTVSA